MPTKKSATKRNGAPTMRQQVAARLVPLMKGETLSTAMGHASFQVDDKIYAFITKEGHIAMKLPADRIAALLEADGDCRLLTMGQRTMREWMVSSVPEDKKTLRLLNEAKTFVASLPEKVSKKNR